MEIHLIGLSSIQLIRLFNNDRAIVTVTDSRVQMKVTVDNGISGSATSANVMINLGNKHYLCYHYMSSGNPNISAGGEVITARPEMVSSVQKYQILACTVCQNSNINGYQGFSGSGFNHVKMLNTIINQSIIFKSLTLVVLK